MESHTGFLRNSLRLAVALTLMTFLFPIGLHAQFTVDCSGNDPSAYPSINSALLDAGPGSSVIVETGPCTENVYVQGLDGLSLGAWWGNTIDIHGSISISESQNVYLYGLNVTSASGNGITIANSRVTVDACTSTGNPGTGLQAQGVSNVSVIAPGTFDNNAGGGINVTDNSLVTLLAWNGSSFDISNNIGPGVYASRGSFTSLGNTTIANNTFGSPLSSGLGVDLRGGATAQFGALFGTNVVRDNQSGGVSLQENAEISFWKVGGAYNNSIRSNGSVGVAVAFGSQVTFFDGTEISDHRSAGVDVYANSQAYFYGQNQVLRNGTGTDALSAGIRVDGNSEAFLRGGTISQNNGPGVLGLVNSSADFSGVTFGGNIGGIITCDSTASMISDLASPNATPAAGVRCKTPHALGNRQVSHTPPSAPNLSPYKAAQARYRKLATKH